ncbi:MAG: hypothetical protein AAGD11_10495 [Planctomycetota bacterium]
MYHQISQRFVSRVVGMSIVGIGMLTVYVGACAQTLTLDETNVTRDGFEIRTDGIFAVWWDPQAGNINPSADATFALLNEVRNDLTQKMGFSDPPNVAAGKYFNVFVHRGDDDRFPGFFGNGVGFEADSELPDLAVPEGLHDDRSNMLHEAFHIFQTSLDYQVVDFNPSAVWIVEASAEWYQASRNSNDPRSFVVSGSPYALPHLPLWYTVGQEPAGVVPNNEWLYGVRDYATSVFLYYLTNVETVDPAIVSGVYTTPTQLTPQQYIYNEVGGDNLRRMFADWAVRTAAGFDYLTEEQVAFTFSTLDSETQPSDILNNILELNASNADGSFSPDPVLTPGGWAYNSIKINNDQDLTYTFDLIGDATGSEGAPAHFEARVAVVSGDSITYQDLVMDDDLTGQFVLNASSSDSEIYFVVASVPDFLEGSQTYDYTVDISTAIGPGLSADFDLDGNVDMDDLAAWQSAYGSAAGGDANLDGTTSGNDFLIWQREFTGSGAVASQSTTVPEPSVIALFVLCLARVLISRRF